LLRLADVPTDATTVEIWARRDNTSCADQTQRSGTGATTPQCYKVASWTRDEVFNLEINFKPIQVIQAIDKLTNVESGDTLDPATVCAKTSSMPPTQVYLQVLAFNGTTVIGYTSSTGTGTTTSGEQIVSLPTSYDLAGPNAPSGLTVGSGNQLLVAKFTSAAATTSDFKGYRAFCFPGPSSSSSALGTKGTDGGLDVLDDAAVDDTSVTDSGSTDSSIDSTDATSTVDSGTTLAAGCPSGVPFVTGELPGPEMDQYICGDESTSATGEIKISKFSSGASLTNGTAYAVVIGSTDRQGNSGPLSTVACGTPKETDDFYSVYRRAGGTAGGGWCAMGRGTSAPFGVAFSVFTFALVARLARRARPRR